MISRTDTRFSISLENFHKKGSNFHELRPLGQPMFARALAAARVAAPKPAQTDPAPVLRRPRTAWLLFWRCAIAEISYRNFDKHILCVSTVIPIKHNVFFSGYARAQRNSWALARQILICTGHVASAADETRNQGLERSGCAVEAK